MISDNTISVRLSADAQELQKAMSQGTGYIESFSGKATGSMRAVGAEAGKLDEGFASLANGIKSAFVGSSIAVGLIGLKNMISDVTQELVQTQIQVDKMRNGLNFAVGAENAAGEMAFLRQSAQSLGLELVSTSLMYTKLAAASRGTTLAGQQTRDVFTSVAQASTVMGLSAEQTEGALLAITQMISKGKVQAEELRGQLGERLPGAFQIAARAMGVTTGELDKMLTTGQVLATDFLPKFAKQLTMETAPALDEASKSMQASVNRMSNAWTDFKRNVNESGVGKAIQQEIMGMGNYVQAASDAMENARKDGFGSLGQLSAGLGQMIARMPFDVLSLASNGLNGSLNLLSGGALKLNTDLNLLPDSLNTNEQRIKALTAELPKAEKELIRLRAQLEKQPGDPYLKFEIQQLFLFVEKAREAKAASDRLKNITTEDATKAGITASGMAREAYEKDRAASMAELLVMKNKLAGVDKDYLPTLEKLQGWRERGIVTEKEYIALVSDLASANYKADKTAKAPKDRTNAFRAEQDAAKSWADALKDAQRISDKATASTNNLNEAQARLVQYLESPAFATNSAEMREVAVSALVAASGVIELADQKKALAKSQDELSKANAKYFEGLTKDLAAQDESNQKLRESNEEIGLSTDALSALSLARMDEVIALEEQVRAEASMREASSADLLFMQQRIDKLKEHRALTSTGAAKTATQELNKATLAEWTKTVDKYDDIFRGGFADMLNNGKGAWDSFTTSLTTTFKTSVADQIYKMFAQPFVVKFVGSMLGIVGGVAGGVANAGSAASTGLSVLSGASSLANIAGSAGALGTATGAISGFTTALTAGAQSLVGITGTTAQMVTSLTAAGHIAAPGVAAGVSAGSSITTALGSIGPAGWAAIAVLAVAAIASGRGETRSGASYITGKDGQAVKEMGPSGGEIAGDQVRALFDTTTTGINSLLKSLGSQASVSAFVAGLESSKAGKGFVYAGGTLSTGAKFGEAGGRNGGEFAFGGQTAEEAIKGYALQLKQATLQALMVAGDIPKQITAILGSVDVTTVAEGVLDDLMGQINAFVVGVGNMQSALELLPIDYLKNLSFATAAGLAEAAGGFDQFGASLGAFYDKFYSESEKTANSTANLSKAFAAMNIVMPAVDDNTRAWYRSEVERLGAMDLSIAANAKAYTSVLSLSSAVDALAPAMKAAADATKAAADATKSTTDAALRSLTAAIEAEQKRVGLIRDLAAESVSSITSVFDLLKEQVAQLYGSVGSTRMMQAGQGNAFIDAALAAVKSTGYLPDSTQLADAIAAARGGLDASQFTSQFEADKAALVMAGKLSQIQAAAGKQLTSAEQSLRVADDQLRALDESLEYYKTQVDLLRGIDTSVLTVAGAIAALQVAMTAEKSASTAPGTKATASANTGAGYAPAGQGPATQDTGFKDRIYLPNGIVGTAITDLDRIGRLDSISAYLAEGHSINEIAETAIKYGVTQKDLAAASGYTDYDVRKTFEGLGIPAYANGGDHAGGLRLVGEKSWEIEATGPSRIWNPQQLGDALRGGGGGNDQTDVADELRQLREENRAQARVVAQLLSDMNKRQREWDTNGLPTERAMA